MSIIEDTKQKVLAFTEEQKKRHAIRVAEKKRKVALAEKDQARKEQQMIDRRNKALPTIEKVAAKYGATVEALDTAAYVYKNMGKREVGTHINYGTSELAISRKLETKFTKSATSSKVLKGFISGMETAKGLREDLGKANKAMKGALGEGGNMYSNPNFGGQFAAPKRASSKPKSTSSTPKKTKKRSSSSNSSNSITVQSNNSLYPDIKW